RLHGHARLATVRGDGAGREPGLVVVGVRRERLRLRALVVGLHVLARDDATRAGARDARQVDAEVLGELAHGRLREDRQVHVGRGRARQGRGARRRGGGRRSARGGTRGGRGCRRGGRRGCGRGGLRGAAATARGPR